MAQNASVPVPRLKPPPRTMLRDTVYESIKAMLMDNDLEPGAKLSIDGIARELEVSPTPVREAMTKLESDGLVINKAHSGYRVAPLLDKDELDNLFDMRMLLEPTAACRASFHATRQQTQEMLRLVDRMSMRPAGDKYDAYRDLIAQDAQLHRLIAEASGNPLIADALSRLHAHTHSYRLYSKIGIARETEREHQMIVDAIKAQEPEEAEQAMRQHILASQQRLRAAYDE